MKDVKEYYRGDYHIQERTSELNKMLYNFIRALEIETIFEFGCNKGRHLRFLRNAGYKVAGIDLNKKAILQGRKDYKLDDLKVGDEKSLKAIGNNKYDVVFTNSVLNHIPDIENIIKDLKRIAKKYVILVETKDQKEGYWYIHEYKKHGFRVVFTGYAEEVDNIYRCYYLRKDGK